MTVPGAGRGVRRVAVVLAAGEGRRFGGAKQLAPFRGRPLLRHAIDAVASRTDVDETVVVLGAHADRVAAGVELDDVTVVRCERWDRGPSASLAAGLAAALRSGADEVLLTLGDQPLLRAATVDRVLATPGDVVRATHGSRPGHPVVLRGAAIAEVAALNDQERRAYLARAARPVDVADVDAGADVDRPGDLDALGP
ncbi:nucleotidyltransferase family protein [Patulibacter sp.]|uniref:nucleotidyltransferase family protein n=1 Tax=Patulibacter sp. TaxID=1912859 RepID=UPI00271EECE9|nr:nucleotidyltransferase family protein [Patulibacter sp.]MDO9408743.1 nucleotidyltransferase family protein [Patulibacter sp.]